MIPRAIALALALVSAPMTIVDLQPFRQTTSAGSDTLVNLNPAINVWYLLTTPESKWHIENPHPVSERISLDPRHEATLLIAESGRTVSCDVSKALPAARASMAIYAPICDGRLYLRNPAKGLRTGLETAAEFFRDDVWGGERVVDFFHHLMGDRYRETGEGSGSATSAPQLAGAPLAALTDSAQSIQAIAPGNLGIVVGAGSLTPGAWYPADGMPGVWTSVFQPNLATREIVTSYRSLVNNLDSVEASSLVYLIAFDLRRFDLGFALGTDYPGVGWSDRVLPAQHISSLPGPDGIGSIAPLISTGLIAPENARRTIATFTGGFKRTHGAFLYGELAERNHGSHYGFMENGVIFSRLQPGLATIFVADDQSVDMKTWTEADEKLLPHIRCARQNGVPIIEGPDAGRPAIPGRLVANWGQGNWSGSEDKKLRTIRAGAALQIHGSARFLIYAVFSDATPSAMARVFQAYQVNYALLLDMNALEHTYLALYRRSGSQLTMEHLIKGMSVLDKSSPNGVIPRFLGYPDNRDFFYVMEKTPETRP